MPNRRSPPRPCLKALLSDPLSLSSSTAFAPLATPALPFATTSHLLSPHVHFPPSPLVSSTYAAHSPTTYDRKPIVVSPNGCALPHRGARDYGYGENRSPLSPSSSSNASSSSSSSSSSPVASYFEPQAKRVTMAHDLDMTSLSLSSSSSSSQETIRPDHDDHDHEHDDSMLLLQCPPLTFSESSSSEDSEGYLSPDMSPPLLPSPPAPPLLVSSSQHPILLPNNKSLEELEMALTFLPHSPSSGGGGGGERTSPVMKKRPGTKRSSTPRPRPRPPPNTRAVSTDGEDDGTCLGGF